LLVLPLRVACKRIKIPVQPSSEKIQSLFPASLQLSIIIVNYKYQDYLIRCLDSLKKNLNNISHEVIVVDNESDEEMLESFRQDFPKTYFISNVENLGYSRAFNQGFKISKGEYILLLNNDTEVLPESLQTMLNMMKQHPTTGVLGCILVNSDHTIQESYGLRSGFVSEVIRKCYSNILYKKSAQTWSKYILKKIYSSDKEVDWICGACMMFKRKALVDVRLMDESFFMYYEDRDVCLQLKEKGWAVRFTPKASIIHHHGISAAKMPIQAAKAYRQSQLYFFKKNCSYFSFWLLKKYLYLKFRLYVGLWSLKKLMITIEATDQSKFDKEMLNLLRNYE